MSKREKILRKCKTCGKEFVGFVTYCSLECLHKSSRARGNYDEKRKILDFLIEHPEKSSREVAKLFGVSKSVTERLSFFTDREREYYDVVEDYFQDIDTEDKAYWLGFLYADGYVKKRQGNSCVVELCLAEIDYYHLEKFKKALKSNYIISKKEIQLNGKTHIAYRFAIYREKMYQDLLDKGCIENKSLKLKFPNRDMFKKEDLIRHFIRGYVDGDGSLGIYSNKGSFSVLGTEDFLTGVSIFLKDKVDDELKLSPHRCSSKGKENIFEMRLGGRYSAKVIKYLYSNSTIYLDRKYQKYLEICDIYKDVL